MESIWMQDVKIKERAKLMKDRTCKVAVIGAGMTGVLTAYKLQQLGLDTIVLEKNQVGGGQTQYTTAKITSQHGVIYQKLLERFPKEFVRQYGEANQKAIEDYADLIQKLKIECDFQRTDSYLYTFYDSKILEKEAKASLFSGIHGLITENVTLPFEIKNALKFENQASFHPLRFLQEMADRVEIFEKTDVTGVEENKIFTDSATIKADYIVFATHIPFLRTPGYYFLRMHQEKSYVTALKNTMQLDGMYYGIDSVGDWSLRNAGEYLLFGGGKHRTDEKQSGGEYEMLRHKAREFWPESQEVAFWSAQDGVTLDGVPYIGRYSSAAPNWYVATGFGKWGMSFAMVAANLISRMIQKQETGEAGEVEYAEVFSPQRFNLRTSAKSIYDEGIHRITR